MKASHLVGPAIMIGAWMCASAHAGPASRPAATQPARTRPAASRPVATRPVPMVRMLEPRIVEHGSFIVAGLDYKQAALRPYLIMQVWVALGPRLHEVPQQVQPLTLYGVWHKQADDNRPAYLIGVQVSDAGDLPEGLSAVTIPAGKYAMINHVGNVAYMSRTYGTIMSWLEKKKLEQSETPSFEVYDTSQPIEDTYSVLIYQSIQ